MSERVIEGKAETRIKRRHGDFVTGCRESYRIVYDVVVVGFCWVDYLTYRG